MSITHSESWKFIRETLCIMPFDPKENELQLGPALLHFVAVFGASIAIALAFGFLMSLVIAGRNGPRRLYSQLAYGLSDLVTLSPRRIWALAMLTIREALRKKALMVGVIFVLLMMFAGWFLSNSNERADLQVSVYVNFVVMAISYLVLPVVLLLCCWGIPDDIKARSLHTVVTKPARRSEVVLGRMLGFSLVGTLVLGLMSAVAYVWTIRQVPEEAKGSLVCRVPVYGDLSFLSREGKAKDKQGREVRGINVGNEWKFREYIEGATKARAVWKFQDITPDSMVDALDEKTGQTVKRLRLESRFEAFRSHKGQMNKSLLVQLVFTNPDRSKIYRHPAFEIKEFANNVTLVDRQLSQYDENAKAFKTLDLFDDLAPNGELTVEVQCLDPGQFIGVARPDFFVRIPDRPFASGFFKAMFGTWLLMVLIIMLGVTASTFVKGPVAILLVLTFVIVGTGFRPVLGDLVKGQQQGGGPFESLIRIPLHLNPTVPLPTGTNFVKQLDIVVANALWLAQQIIPDFRQYFEMKTFVTNGFDVDWRSSLLPCLGITLAYVLPCFLIGYFSLRLRELEAK